MVKIKAKGKKVLVRQLPRKNVTEGGIILPGKSKGDISDYENWLAEVIDLGEKCIGDIELQIGDIVMMDPSYAPIMFDDPNHIKGNQYSEPLMMSFVTYEQILSTVVNN